MKQLLPRAAALAVLTIANIVGGPLQPAHAQAYAVSGPVQSDPEKTLAGKITDAVESCSAAYTAHKLATHADAVICATEPITKAFQEAKFPDMDLVFELESTTLDAASKLDHGQIAESDFRTAFIQATLHLKAEEAQRASRRAYQVAEQQKAQAAQDRAQADQEQAATQQAEAARQERRRAIIQQIIQNQQAQQQLQQQNAAAFMGATSNLMGARRPTNCTTMVSGQLATTNCN